MKRTIALLSSLIMVLSLCACGGESTDSNTNASKDGSVYKLGDTIETDLFKITPSFTGYAKRLSNQPNEDYTTPAGYFTDDSPYIAGDEKVEIYGEMKIEYVGNEKSTVPLKIDISADYDNGYVFDGDAVYMGYHEADDESWHWKYDDTIEFEPLSSSTTRILRYCVEVPEQVETNADKALLVTISVNDEPFVFDFRSADVLGSDYDPRAEFYQPVDDETKQQIVAYLKANGLKEMGWYEQNVNYFEFTFDDENVYARMPLASNPDYGYDFNGTYEVFAKTILITWDYGTQMHLDYTFDGNSLTVTEFDYNR